jgi:hypothetical protein
VYTYTQPLLASFSRASQIPEKDCADLALGSDMTAAFYIPHLKGGELTPL